MIYISKMNKVEKRVWEMKGELERQINKLENERSVLEGRIIELNNLHQSIIIMIDMIDKQ